MFGVDNGSTGRKAGLGRAFVAVAAGVGATETGVCEDCPPTNILHAAYVGALELLKSMVARGVAPDAPDVLRGSTPLHWACFGGHLNVVRWLVRTAGAETDRPNNDGCTPLLFACERGHMGVAQWLVREGGAKVNVRDSVMWQTPLHRVCLNAQRDTHGATVSDVEELILWLVEAGADLTAVDRFGNHVEDLRTATELGSLMSSSHAKLCDMIYLARQEGATKEGAREKLRRRSSVRRKSTGDLGIQLSPKLEAKQRAPLSRRGSRKGSNGSSGGSRGASSSSSASPAAPQVLTRTASYGSTPQSGNRQSHQRRSSGGRVVSKTPPNGSEEAEFFSASPVKTQRGNGGSGGGVAAAASGAGARMGGGPPAPAIAGLDLLGGEVQEEGGAGYMDEMVAMFGGGKVLPLLLESPMSAV